jgi:hypothetical protein
MSVRNWLRFECSAHPTTIEPHRLMFVMEEDEGHLRKEGFRRHQSAV